MAPVSITRRLGSTWLLAPLPALAAPGSNRPWLDEDGKAPR
ncbi:MAG: hypothetical protein ACOZJX_05770 [Pseudomonadota bacterium]